MKKSNRTLLFSALIVLAYVLSSCSGAPARQSTNDQQASSGKLQDVVFTGTVKGVNGNQWTISGQTITVKAGTALGSNIAVGDHVKVEAQVAADGSVTAVRIEISGADNVNTNANSNSSNGNDSNANDNTSNSNDNQGDNSNTSNGNGNGNDNSNTANDQEVSGVVEAISTESITINGVVYMIADFTEFKDLIAMGDQVKLHVIVNADGTVTIREIEKSPGTSLDNSNSNSNGSDDNSNINSNSNGDDKGGNNNGGNDNGNSDDHGNDNGGGGGNDNGGGGNGNG